GNSAGANSRMGYVDRYDYSETATNNNVDITKDDWTHITIAKMTAGDKVTGTQAELFGYVTFKGRREINATDTGNAFGYTVLTSSGYSQADRPFFDDTYSSALLFEEATYPNNVKLTALTDADTKVTGLAEGATLGTFSAPFPTVIPENVTAYYAEEGTGSVTLKAITEAALPANKGVLLVGNGVTSACMMPAADEAQASISSNFFLNTAGVTHTTVANDYILAKGSDGIAFYPAKVGGTLAMNKAYLSVSSTSPALELDFGSTQTGLAETVVTLDSKAPMYDLQGRRVFQPAKGSLIIQNGKKLIVK
ncbi:MAG: hypothetical protein ACI3YD_06230, partial [Alloprevotella sp.]